MSDDKDLFVGLTNQELTRLNLLESAKLTTLLLKNYEKISFIHKEKRKESLRLNLLFSEIKSLMNNLNFKDISFSDDKQVDHKTIKFNKQTEQESKLPKVKKDKLTEDLEEIERKLNSLKF